jgi:hypothetical protein
VRNRVQEDEALNGRQNGKQIVEVELDEQCFLTDECDEEDISRDLQHYEKPFSLARGREKRDRKSSKRYDFVYMISFALTTGSR